MTDNTVQIIVHATDAASGVMRGITSQFGALGGVVEQLTAQNINWGNVAQSATNLVIDGAKQVIKYIQDSVDLYDKYTTSIVDESRVLGLSTEETSRLVQASDDLFLSQDKLNTAMLAASRQGIDTSINGLQKLSEKYLALEPGVERTQFLLKTFGRSGADMGKLMEQGADGIRTSMNAIADWMIVTDDTVVKVQDYKRSLDKVQEAQESFKYSIAQGVMPAETALNNQLAQTTDSINKSGAATKTLSFLEWMLQGALAGVEVIFGKQKDSINETTSSLDKNTAAVLRNASSQNVLASSTSTSRGSIYDSTYTGAPGTSRGSIYNTASHANGISGIIPESYGYEGFRLGNGDTASGGEGIQIIPKNQTNVDNNDALNATLKSLPKMIAREIRQLEKYQK